MHHEEEGYFREGEQNLSSGHEIAKLVNQSVSETLEEKIKAHIFILFGYYLKNLYILQLS